MRILMIFQLAPLPPPLDMGPAKRNYPFLRENLKRHEVSVLSFGSPGEENIFRERHGNDCKSIHFINVKRPRIINIFWRLYFFITLQSTFRIVYRRKMQKAIDELTSSEDFDIIHCCFEMFGYYRFPSKPLLVGDTHNVEYDIVYLMYKQSKNLFWKIYNYQAYKCGKRDEIKSLNKFDAIITTTKNDSDKFREDIKEKPIFTIQNGVDTMFFEKSKVTTEQKTMVFMGLMNYYPNDHAINYFLDHIYPLIISEEPESRLLVVGANPSKKLLEYKSEKIVITGFVDDVRPHISRAEVFIIPLLIGGGIRGKALEAMAMKIPIVTTTLGCAGIYLKHSESALFADTPEDFSKSVLKLFNDQDLRQRLSENAHTIVRNYYDWEKKGDELDHVYRTHSKIKLNVK
jgi:glycosyltransferase involved in cell wall biosynthesis